MLHPDFRMAAPGIPLSLSEELYNKHRHRVIHDWLQIGTAVMMGELCNNMGTDRMDRMNSKSM